MKKTALLLGTGILASVYFLWSDRTTITSTEEQAYQVEAPNNDPDKRKAYELSLIVDPETGLVPEGVKQLELEWAHNAPKKFGKVSNTYTPMGPDNLGGRTRAIAFDVRGADTILAGCVSSGVFKSTDAGASWEKVSPSDEIHNVTTIVQDPRSGHEDTWYYAGGEASGNSTSGSGATYMGYGVYKSTDNGETWSRLTASNPYSLESFNWYSDFVQRLAVDPTDGDIYMACLGSIYRSTNGGTSWSAVLQAKPGFINTGWQTDVIITPGGRKYVSFSGTSPNGYDGVWVSQTGDSGDWEQIAEGGSTPTGWNSANGYGRVVLAYAPSDTSQVYALYWDGTTSSCSSSPSPEAELFKYDNANDSWTDLSANLPDESGCLSGNDPFACQGGYDLCIAIQPDDTNTIVIGGTNAYRSTDGFSSTSNTTRIGGYASASSYSLYTNHHPDIHTFVFHPDDDDSLFTGSDGGIHKCDISVSTPAWTSLNNDYQTYQYYHVAIAPDAYKEYYIGGCQDNGTVRSFDNDPSQEMILSGDGCATGIAESSGSYTEFVSVQNGTVYRRLSTLSSGFINANITPSGYSSNSNFVTYFYLDPDNTDYLYYANGDDLVRNTSAKSATTTTGWTNMTGTNTTISGGDIHSFATTRGPYDASTASLFIGCDDGSLYRLDDPANASASTTPTDITPTGMSSGTIKDISVNPRNDDTIMVVYSNYSVSSIWWTGNANSSSPTWVNIEGNASTPSIRSCEIVLTNSGLEYYIGTSVGLYSTTSLSGGTTTWAQEGSSVIEYAVVSALAYRPEDNVLLVGTHGNGLYLAEIGSPADQTIDTTSSSVIMDLGPNEKKMFKTDDGVIAEIENLDNHDYGNTTVEIDNTGSGTMTFDNNTASDQEILEKTIRITPTTNNSSGNVKITMFFSEDEIDNWKTATGWGAKDLALIKSTGAISSGTKANTVEGTSIVIDSTYDGEGVQITATFSNGFSGVGGGKSGANGPLPVTFTSFELVKASEAVELNWTTAHERDNDKFEIQRSLDGNKWTTLGEVKGAGTTTQLTDYSFMDASLAIENYNNACYRLKQIDYNGTYEYSEIRCVENTSKSNVRFAISPNPVTDYLRVNIHEFDDANYVVKVYDMEGNVVHETSALQSNKSIDLTALKGGHYIAVVERDNEMFKNFRFIKL
jgi:hypothetical protein